MPVLSHLRLLLGWAWRCGRAWIEMGHRVAALEKELHRQAELHRHDDAQLTSEIAAASEAHRARIQQVHRRIDDLDRTQSDRLALLDRTQQHRIDDWAQQLSDQINRLYLTLTRPVTSHSDG